MSRWPLTRTLWNNIHCITKLNLAQSLHIYFKSLIRSATKTFIVALNQNLGWLCSLTFSKCNDIWSILVFLDLKKTVKDRIPSPYRYPSALHASLCTQHSFHAERSLASKRLWSYEAAWIDLPAKNRPFRAETALFISKTTKLSSSNTSVFHSLLKNRRRYVDKFSATWERDKQGRSDGGLVYYTVVYIHPQISLP